MDTLNCAIPLMGSAKPLGWGEIRFVWMIGSSSSRNTITEENRRLKQSSSSGNVSCASTYTTEWSDGYSYELTNQDMIKQSDICIASTCHFLSGGYKSHLIPMQWLLSTNQSSWQICDGFSDEWWKHTGFTKKINSPFATFILFNESGKITLCPGDMDESCIGQKYQGQFGFQNADLVLAFYKL